jgi:hypothetical protein
MIEGNTRARLSEKQKQVFVCSAGRFESEQMVRQTPNDSVRLRGLQVQPLPQALIHVFLLSCLEMKLCELRFFFFCLFVFLVSHEKRTGKNYLQVCKAKRERE